MKTGKKAKSAAHAEAESKEPAFTRDYAPVGFVVVGLGMGHGRAAQLRATSGLELLGVCDTDGERLRRARDEFTVPAAADLADLLDNPAVEAVFVLTPTGRHAEVALPALRAGKHVLLTKPMEACLQACDKMISEAEARRRLLAVDFQMRLDPGILGLRAGLSAGSFGKFLGGECALKINRADDYYGDRGGWRGTRRWDGGGVFSNQAIHHIDQVVHVLGAPARVKSEIRTLNHVIEAEDLGFAWWEYPGGAVVTFHATTNYPYASWHYRLELYGTAGACLLSAGGGLEKPLHRWYSNGAWSDEAPVSVKPEWSNSADNFAAALRTGAPLICSGRDARRTQAVLDAMYRSAYGSRDWVEPAVLPEPPVSGIISNRASGDRGADKTREG